MIYTEEDKLIFLLGHSSNFRRLLKEFELEIDFAKQPPITQKQYGDRKRESF